MRPSTQTGPIAIRRDGQPVRPGDGIVPILKEISPGRLKVAGTAFYVTRYGLFLTAKHVLEDLVLPTGDALGTAFILHLSGDDAAHLRPIRKAFLLEDADVAAGQADNFTDTATVPLQNLTVALSPMLPPAGSALITYGYPENAILDFNQKAVVPTIHGVYAEGGFLRFVEKPEHPLLKFPYFESSVQVLSGASGGPIYFNGRVIGINSRGWDFRGSDPPLDPLSYIAPIGLALDIQIDPFQVPAGSWDQTQIPSHARGRLLSIRELAAFGHVRLEESV